MMRNLLISAKRALGASIIVGCILVVAVGGPDAPDAGSMIKVSMAGFFIFWLVFALLFRPARPQDHSDGVNLVQGSDAARAANRWLRGDVHTDDGIHHSGSHADPGHSGGDIGSSHSDH